MDYRMEMLTAALEARQREVTEYQVNIDNFRLAIVEIGDDPQLQDFKAQLRSLLADNELEQRKAKVMLKVIERQVSDVFEDR